jgi:hypothetical protein
VILDREGDTNNLGLQIAVGSEATLGWLLCLILVLILRTLKRMITGSHSSAYHIRLHTDATICDRNVFHLTANETRREQEASVMTTRTIQSASDTSVTVIEGYSRRLLDAIEMGGAWSREARAILQLAAQAGVRLDEETLLWSDVHDLQMLRLFLRSQDAA